MKIVENPSAAVPERDPMFVNVPGYRQPLEQPVQRIPKPDASIRSVPNQNAKS